jgi:hypothetical protein
VLCRALLCVLLQRRRNATRLCEHIVSGQCLQQKLPEACIAELLAAQSASKSSKTTTIAVAVSVAVGGGLLLMVVGACCWTPGAGVRVCSSNTCVCVCIRASRQKSDSCRALVSWLMSDV